MEDARQPASNPFCAGCGAGAAHRLELVLSRGVDLVAVCRPDDRAADPYPVVAAIPPRHPGVTIAEPFAGARRRFPPRFDVFDADHRLPGRSGVAHGRCDRPHAVAPGVTRRHLLEWVPAAQTAIGPGLISWAWRAEWRRDRHRRRCGDRRLDGGHGSWSWRSRSPRLGRLAGGRAPRQFVSRGGRSLVVLRDGRAPRGPRGAPGGSSRPSSPRGTTVAARQFSGQSGPAVAHRTSPTNLGLYLLSVVCARDFG